MVSIWVRLSVTTEIPSMATGVLRSAQLRLVTGAQKATTLLLQFAPT